MRQMTFNEVDARLSALEARNERAARRLDVLEKLQDLEAELDTILDQLKVCRDDETEAGLTRALQQLLDDHERTRRQIGGRV